MTDGINLTPSDSKPLYVPNLERYSKDPQHPAVVRALAYDRLTDPHGYLRVGDWIRSLNAADLYLLGRLAEIAASEGEATATYTYIGLTVILSSGEGIVFDNDDQIQQGVQLLMLIVTMEALARKGLIEVSYDNLSLDPSADADWAKVVDHHGLENLRDQYRKETGNDLPGE
jgi:hypothetical protein